jgi:chromosomal replication initiator protein
MDRRQVWRAVLGELEISLSQATFETWFRRTALLRVDESTATFVLGVQSGFAKDWVDERYRSLIAQTLAKVVGYSVTLSVEVVSDAELDAHGALATKGKGVASIDAAPRAAAPQESVRIVDREAPARATNLNARYTFATYVVGAANRLAHAASLSVSERPGGAYNPLFLYGGTGLGKTHLLSAVAHRIREKRPERRVMMLTAERFMINFVMALRQRDTLAFKDQFQAIDVLLIDDFQFLQGKTMQQEFCNAFNSLVDSRRQVIVAADVPPAQLDSIDLRMRSRLMGGLVVDIELPGSIAS